MQEKVPAARHAAGVVMLCSLALDRAGRASLTPCMADEAALTTEAVQTVQTPYGQALRCNGVSKTGKRCGKAALRGAKTCGIHGPTGAGYWSRDGVREDPRLFPNAAGGYYAPPTEVVMSFLTAQERSLRISRQAAAIDAVSLELVHGLVEGMVQVIATFVPPAREVEALGALYDWQASLLPGVVRL